VSQQSSELGRLCGGTLQSTPTTGDTLTVTAPRAGGTFDISRSAEALIPSLSDSDIVSLRRRIWESSSRGDKLSITSNYLERRSFTTRPTFEEMGADLLRWIRGQANPLPTRISMFPQSGSPPPELLAMLCTNDNENLVFFLQYLAGKGLIDWTPDRAQLKPEGVIYLEERSRTVSWRTQAFVAMWFGDETTAGYRDGIEPAIREAGYDPMRVDRHEHINRIDDEILAQIRTSRLLVADFTCEPNHQRGGVYFEADFALGIGLPVFWTAREGTEVHFDTRQYNHIFWKDPADLKQRLRNRIVALIGEGSKTTGGLSTGREEGDN
jgi:hypothetical protein